MKYKLVSVRRKGSYDHYIDGDYSKAAMAIGLFGTTINDYTGKNETTLKENPNLEKITVEFDLGLKKK